MKKKHETITPIGRVWSGASCWNNDRIYHWIAEERKLTNYSYKLCIKYIIMLIITLKF